MGDASALFFDYEAAQKMPDLSHHLSLEARSRLPNPIKAIWKIARRKPDMISLANGDPHFSLYPIRKVEFEVPSVDEEDPVSAWKTETGETRKFVTSTDPSCSLSIRSAMQYSNGAGLVEAQQALTRLTDLFHQPCNHIVTPTLGNYDGLAKCFRLLGDRGDTFLADEFTFTAVTNAPVAYGVKWCPVAIDDRGMIPKEMDRILTSWNESEQGRRPHVLYTVPCGQNPTGITLDVERRKEIYALAHKWDLIILEDDPYYFLQFDAPHLNRHARYESFGERFARTFLPSFLSMDVDGRVIRIDSFSKILAPGMRLGWITSSPMFHDYIVSYTDSASQHPHGLGQAFITEMLGHRGWRLDGFGLWLQSLREEYERRRNFFLDVFERETGSTDYACASPPQAGMFVWLRVNFERHPRYQRRLTGAKESNVPQLTEELFNKCLEMGLVLMPASVFALEGPHCVVMGEGVRDKLNHFRATFSGTEETIERGLVIFGRALREFFGEANAVEKGR